MDRMAENDMTHLVEWAHDAHDRTTNQGAKPGLVYIIDMDSNLDPSEWMNGDFATTRIMAKLQASTKFKSMQHLWRTRNTKVETVQDLLHCYYSNIRVVFIPYFDPSRPCCEAAAMKEQYSTLYRVITELSSTSADRRKVIGTLFDLDSLSIHTIGVLEKLAQDYQSTVDLHGLVGSSQEYPTGFSSHVLDFLVRFGNSSAGAPGPSRQTVQGDVSLVKNLCNHIALCVGGEISRVAGEFGSQCCRWQTRNDQKG